MIIYLPIIIKLGLGILCLIVQINLMGKGNLAPSSAMDQVQNYVLGGIIGGVIYNESITVLQFVLVLIIWTF
ncbi:membrane protein, partial [Raoultella planticola]